MKTMRLTYFNQIKLAVIFTFFLGSAMAQSNRTSQTAVQNNKVKSYSQVNAAKAAGDTILFEDFNSGMPSNFILVNEDSLIPQPNYLPVFGDTAWIVTTWTGTTSPVASSCSWYAPAGQADDWMIIPVTLPDARTFLQWDAQASDTPPFNDGYEVYIGTSPTVSSLLSGGPVFSIPGEFDASPITRTINLADLGFRNSTVYIAFRNNSNDRNLLWIDNILVAESFSNVQIVHNSADLAAGLVDIYLDNTLALDSVAFQTASGFLTVPDSFNLKITPAGAGVGSAVYDQNIQTIAGESYVAVASGIVSSTGYNPAPAFDIFAVEGRESASQAGNTDVLVFHGSTDAPIVTVNELTLPTNLIDTISYSNFSNDYLELPTGDYVLEVTDSSGVQLYYGAPLQTLGLTDAAIVVVASGFVDPSQNSNGAGFGLFAVLPSGGAFVPLPVLEQPKLQIIHNSADAAAASVDIFVDGANALPAVTFRSATGYIGLPHEFELDIAPAGAGIGSSVFNAGISLMPGEKYVVIANGIVSASGYNPSPAFGLDVFQGGREAASQTGNTDVLIYHGSTDAPTVDVNETSVPAGNLASGLSYQDFAADYLELATADYVVQVTDNAGVDLSYQAPLATLNLTDAAIVVLASGFVDPSQNSNGAGFGLWAATAAGGALVELPLVTGLDNSDFVSQFKVFPNPAVNTITIETNDINVTNARIVNILGQTVKEFDLNAINSGSLNVSDIERGSYFLQIESANEIGSLPVVIE